MTLLGPKAVIKSIVVLICIGLAVNGYSAEKFKPTVESLQQYECPKWFRDAKFGIYLHWGAYSVVERGEWYARKLYEEGGEDYAYHLELTGILQNLAIRSLFHCGRRRNLTLTRY